MCLRWNQPFTLFLIKLNTVRVNDNAASHWALRVVMKNTASLSRAQGCV